MIRKKLIYQNKFEVLSISVIKTVTSRGDYGLSPIGATLTEYDREYFRRSYDVQIILVNGEVIKKNDVTPDDIDYINRSTQKYFDLMNTDESNKFMSCLELSLADASVIDIKGFECFPKGVLNDNGNE